MLENLDMAGAVHRLDRKNPLIVGVITGRLRHEHVFFVPAPMARRLPQRLIEKLRRVDLVIAQRAKAATHIGDEGLKQRPPFRMPEDRTWPLFLEMEQVHLAAKATVIAFFRFFQLMEIGFKRLRSGKSGRINPRQHRIVAVAAPIGTGHLHQLERIADLAGRRHMRATAQVKPVALLVNFQIFTGRNGVDEFNLEGLAFGFEQAANIVALPNFLGKRLVARDDLAHLGLDRRKIIGGKGLFAVKIVVKSVLDHRSNRDLRLGPERLHGFGQHMGAIMADQFQRARIIAAYELDLSIVGDRVIQIGNNAIQSHGDGPLGERG